VSRARVRRPLIALIVLIAALVIGYTVRALQSGDHHAPSPAPSMSSVPSVSSVSS
jgi:hypothetical protein